MFHSESRLLNLVAVTVLVVAGAFTSYSPSASQALQANPISDNRGQLSESEESYKAYRLIQNQQADAARSAILEQIQKRPQSVLSHALRAYWARTINRPDYAVAYGNVGLDATGEQPLLFLEVAAAHFLQGNIQAARVYLRKIFTLSDRKKAIYFYALYLDGLLYLKEESLDYASFRFMEALQNHPPSRQGLYLVYANLGVTHHRLAFRYRKKQQRNLAKQHQSEAVKFYGYTKSIATPRTSASAAEVAWQSHIENNLQHVKAAF